MFVVGGGVGVKAGAVVVIDEGGGDGDLIGRGWGGSVSGMGGVGRR